MKKRTVRQYTRAGKFIAEYDSIRAAAMLTGMPHSSISSACSGIYTMAGNCIWRYADEVANGSENENIQGLRSFMDVFPEMAKDWSPENSFGPDEVAPHSRKKVLWICRKGHPDYWMTLVHRAAGSGCPICGRLRLRKKVSQYSKSGKKIKDYASAIEAAEEIGISPVGIGTACREKKRVTANYYWRFTDEVSDNAKDEIPPGLPKSFLSEHPDLAKDWSPENPARPDEVLPTACVKVLWICPAGHPDYWMMPKDRAWGRGCPVCARLRKQAYYKKISKPVYQMKWNGQIIAEYPSISAASRETEILHSTISLACNGKCQTAGGFRWCFAPKDEEDL